MTLCLRTGREWRESLGSPPAVTRHVDLRLAIGGRRANKLRGVATSHRCREPF
jgi:hypothetical protein